MASRQSKVDKVVKNNSVHIGSLEDHGYKPEGSLSAADVLKLASNPFPHDRPKFIEICFDDGTEKFDLKIRGFRESQITVSDKDDEKHTTVVDIMDVKDDGKLLFIILVVNRDIATVDCTFSTKTTGDYDKLEPVVHGAASGKNGLRFNIPV